VAASPARSRSSSVDGVGEKLFSNNPVNVAGFDAGHGWDATTGLGTPRANVVVPYLAFAGDRR
jgi:hypothetical protein